jgi:hypothetical protein
MTDPVESSDALPIGSVVFALIDPSPGHEIEFNHWYERDHFYTAGAAAPGVFSAGRYIAPRSCKDLRGASGVGADLGSHLALYFVMEGHDEARVDWAMQQVRLAAEEDRMFTERTHVHTWSYGVEWTWVSDADGVPPALSLDRRYDASTVVMVDLPAGAGREESMAALRSAWSDVDGPAAVVLALRPGYEIMPAIALGEIDPDRRMTFVCFHDGDVDTGWQAVRSRFAELEHEGICAVAWASPFVVSIFGTDLYADEL